MSLLTLFQKNPWNTLHGEAFSRLWIFHVNYRVLRFWDFFSSPREFFFFFTKPINWLLAVGSALTLLIPELFPCGQFECCDVTCWFNGNIHPVLSRVLCMLHKLSDHLCLVCTVGMTALLTAPRSESQPSWERSWRSQSYLVRVWCCDQVNLGWALASSSQKISCPVTWLAQTWRLSRLSAITSTWTATSGRQPGVHGEYVASCKALNGMSWQSGAVSLSCFASGK